MARAKRVCSYPTCPVLVDKGRCTTHQRVAEQQRGSRQQRGYDAAHDRLRARWKLKVDAGTVHCHATTCLMPARWITPGMPWDLGHTDDRTTWTGPEHQLCNRAAGGHAAHRHTR